MKILVTGAEGFIGKNLVAELGTQNFAEVFKFDIATEPALFEKYCKEAEFVFHLAGINRPQNKEEFMTGNFGLTENLLKTLKKYNNKCPVMLSSSTQASQDNPYGASKKAGEDLLLAYGKETGAKVMLYRFPNVFGKWCRPNYNSAVATFCNNIASGLPIQINDAEVVLNLVYIDDVVQELVRAIKGGENQTGAFCAVKEVYTVKVGEIAELIKSFKDSRKTLTVHNMADAFTRKLYSTYLSYLPADGFSYPLKMNVDNRGSFTEFLKTPDRGQVSVNISKPGITKGNHWHHSKNEKFLVASGKGVIRFRKVGTDEVLEYRVSGEKLEVVDIPTGYTHNIENIGETDMVTVMWVNECYDPEKPDTNILEV